MANPIVYTVLLPSYRYSQFLNSFALLAFIALSAAQSSAQTHIHSAIVVIDTSNNAWHSQVHWLVGTPYLAIKASNDYWLLVISFQMIHFLPSNKFNSRVAWSLCLNLKQ